MLCRAVPRTLVGMAIAGALAHHLRYMLTVKFDYGWNMTVCIACGALTGSMWLVWSLVSSHPAR